MIRTLRALAVFLRIFPFRKSVEWLPTDSKALEAFLHSGTGRKMMVLLENEVIAANERAALAGGSPFKAGEAVGFKAFLAWIESFAAQQPESQPGYEVTEDLEHLLP